MKRKVSFIVVLLILSSLIIIPSLASAVNGCFVDKESSKYCTDISDIEAQEECSFSDTCDLTLDFLEDQLCTFVDECQKILCKSSCKVEYRGQCVFGEVPQGDEQEWCSSGCCQFTFGNQEYCQSTPGQWKCEVEAINRDQTTYGFESNANCETSCQDFTYQATSYPVSISKKQFTTILLEESKKPVKKETSPPKEAKNEDEKESSFSFFWWILIIGLIILIAVKWKSWFKSDDGNLVEEGYAPKSPGLFSPFLSNPFTKARIKKMKREHKHKRKEQRMENLFGEAGLTLPKEVKPSQNFEELERRIKNAKVPIINTYVTKLNQIANQRERKEKNTFNTLKELQKREQSEVFKKLRQISQKNK
ncbi:hypothetical protein HQ489_01740 [Candidatus Woesearchaeota archaeon]|nr:hypothetical protein [Candidatus Woesearchaeota archaeon]